MKHSALRNFPRLALHALQRNAHISHFANLSATEKTADRGVAS